MEKNEIGPAGEGMHYFSTMSASATHEIKNNLAIINETAGFLGDLAGMAEKGHPLSLERIKDISQKLIKQVRRADLVLKKINHMSHGVGKPMETVDLEKTLNFVLDLGFRLIEKTGVCVKVISPPFPVEVTTHLFYLENMIWRAIESACAAAEGERQVTISFGPRPGSPGICFSMDGMNPDQMDQLMEAEQERALMAYLNLSIEKNRENGSFGLLWPEST